MKQVIRRGNIDEIPYIEFKYGVFRMDRLHNWYPKPERLMYRYRCSSHFVKRNFNTV